MKKLITLAVMLMLAASASAQSNNETQRKPKGPFSFGIGYDYAIFAATTIENNIIGKQKVKDAYVDMHMLTLNFDYAVTPRWTAGLVTGYTGYGIPLLFEAKHFWNNDVNSSRWLTYANMGVNFSGTDKIKAGGHFARWRKASCSEDSIHSQGCRKPQQRRAPGYNQRDCKQ